MCPMWLVRAVPGECGGSLDPAAGVTGGSGAVEPGFLPRRIVPRVEAVRLRVMRVCHEGVSVFGTEKYTPECLILGAEPVGKL